MSNDGGPAFPYSALVPDQRTGTVIPTMYSDSKGMTLRDYFAAKAMQALVGHLSHGIRPQDCIVMAEDAYTLADAMLRARNA